MSFKRPPTLERKLQPSKERLTSMQVCGSITRRNQRGYSNFKGSRLSEHTQAQLTAVGQDAPDDGRCFETWCHVG